MKKLPILSAVLLLSAFALSPLTALEVPPLRGHINDNAGVLSASAERELESYLTAVEGSSGAQIALLTIDSLEGENLESYSIRVVENWQLGDEGQDNGVLLLVAMAEKKIRIEVGYGLEGVLTDAASGYIIRESITPEFRRGNFDRGIAAGLNTIGSVVAGDVVIDEKKVADSGENADSAAGSLFIIVFLMIFVLGRMGRYRRYRARGMSPWGAFFLGSMLGSSRGHSSGGFGGGFGGGGFSGGGGGFGGGGASGGW